MLCLGISKFTLTWCCFDSRFFMWYVRRWVFMRLHQTSKHSSAMPSLFKNALYSILLSHQEKNVRVCCHFLGFLLTALMLHLHEEIILRNLDKQNTAKELWPWTLRQSTKVICALLYDKKFCDVQGILYNKWSWYFASFNKKKGILQQISFRNKNIHTDKNLLRVHWWFTIYREHIIQKVYDGQSQKAVFLVLIAILIQTSITITVTSMVLLWPLCETICNSTLGEWSVCWTIVPKDRTAAPSR